MQQQNFAPDEAARALVDAFVLVAALNPARGSFLGEDGVGFVTTGTSLATFNGVVSLGKNPDPRSIERMAAQYAGSPYPWSIQLREEPTEEILRIGRAVGLNSVHYQPLMTTDLPTAPLGLNENAAGYLVEEVTGVQSGEYLDALAGSFEMDPAGALAFTEPALLDSPNFTAYLGRIDGEATAVGATTVRDGKLGLFSIATMPAFRRRGFSRALTKRMIDDGIRRGARGAFLQASAMGKPLYESLGFREVENWAYLV